MAYCKELERLVKRLFVTDNYLVFQLSNISLCHKIIARVLALDFLEWVYKIFEFLEVKIFVHWKSPNVINTYHHLSYPLVFIKRFFSYQIETYKDTC